MLGSINPSVLWMIAARAHIAQLWSWRYRQRRSWRISLLRLMGGFDFLVGVLAGTHSLACGCTTLGLSSPVICPHCSRAPNSFNWIGGRQRARSIRRRWSGHVRPSSCPSRRRASLRPGTSRQHWSRRRIRREGWRETRLSKDTWCLKVKISLIACLFLYD